MQIKFIRSLVDTTAQVAMLQQLWSVTSVQSLYNEKRDK